MGARLVLSTAYLFEGVEPPSLPYSYGDPSLQGPETWLSDRSLFALRLVATLSAALGLALIAGRLGWGSVPGLMAFLVIPHVRDDLARAWAEGPLLLGVGLCFLSWGTRWFAVACGVAGSFKLTAVVAWPLSVIHGWGTGRPSRPMAALIPPAVWVLLTPASWFSGGPLFLIIMWMQRAQEYGVQSAAGYEESIAGFFFPTRYIWPVELALCLIAAILIFRYSAVRLRSFRIVTEG